MRRAPELIPFSRFHKRVLFIGESCKSDGARFEGYPIDAAGRAELLREFEPLLLNHLKNLEQIVALVSGIDSKAKRLAENHSRLRELLKAAKADEATEEHLNAFGLELVAHIRYIERNVFQKIQEVASADELNRIKQLAETAGFYSKH